MKKLLALVLALVMTLSLCVVSSNAAYSDKADIDLKEAAEVMSAVGVFEGSDGKFSPKDILTREQAAKLIAYLDLGKTVADNLPAVKVFNDVEATRWSAKYVAYCADAGYLAGVGNNNFDPAGKLTGYAFGKMVLCVLGYDATIEGFTGANWIIKVAKFMEANAIADGIDASASLNLTREQAAQYCLNALQATMVGYDSKGTSISINGATIATGASSADPAKALKPGTLMNALYGGKLLKTPAHTAFGAPAHTWTYKADEVGTYADSADKTLKGTVTKGDLYSAIGSVAMGALGTVSVEVDGKDQGYTRANLNTIAVKGNTTTVANTGNGTKTEVFVDYNNTNKNYDVTVVVTNTYLAKVTSVTAATASAKRYVTVNFKSTNAAAIAGSGTQLLKFETESFAKNDYVLVTCAEDANGDFAIKTMAAAPAAVSGKVTSVKGTSNFVMDGTTYKYALMRGVGAPAVNDTLDVYCDADGYVLYYEATAASTALENYLVVLAATADGLGNVKANVVTLDGKVVKGVTLGKLGTTSITTAGAVAKNKIYGFTVNDKGVYNLKTVAAPFDGTTNYTKTSAAYNTGDLTYVGTTTAKVNAATTFVIYDKQNDSVKTYVGMTKAPTVGADTRNEADALVKSGTASAVFMNVAASASITDTSAATDIIYVLDATAVETKSGSDSIYTYDVIKDGKVTTLSAKSAIFSAVGTWSVTQYNGEYVSAAAAVGNNTNATVGTTSYKVLKVDFTGAAADIDFADGLFTLGTYSLLADTDVTAWTVSADGVATETTLSGLEKLASTDTYYVVTKKNATNNLYYVVAAYCQK